MGNPFESIEIRLASIEQRQNLILDLLSKKKENRDCDSIDIKEVARILHLSVDTIYTKTHKKTIPHRKEGKKLLFSRKEIDNYLISNRVLTMKEEISENENFVSKRLKSKSKYIAA